MKRCTALLIIREMQVKSSVRYHLKPVRIIIIIKKSTNNNSWRTCGKKRALLHCWQEYELVQPLWRRAWRILKKLNIELPSDPAIPLLGIYLEETIIRKDTCTPGVYCSTIYNSQNMGNLNALTEEWIKIRYIYTIGKYSAIKKRMK